MAGLVTAAIFVFLLLLVLAGAHILLIMFSGILTATFIRSMTRPLARLTRLPHALAFLIVLLGFTAAFSLAGRYLSPRVGIQVNELIRQIPAALQSLQNRVQSTTLGSELISQVPDLGDLLRNKKVLQEVRGLFSVTLGFFADLFIFFFITIYLTVDPDLYIRGFLRLVPPKKRKRAVQVFDAIATTLRRWLLGTLVSMASTGSLPAWDSGFSGFPWR